MRVIYGQNIGNELVRLVDRAEGALVLVSGYYDPWPNLTRSVEGALARHVKVTVVLRGGHELEKHTQRAAAWAQKGATVRYVDRLHAKFYVSDKEAIVTSMNLVGTSAQDSWEIAVHFDKADTAAWTTLMEAFKDLVNQVKLDETRRAAEQTNVLAALMDAAPARRAPAPAAAASPSRAAATSGHCIRCGEGIALNPERPLCKPCYTKWAQYENADYEEAYCHSCGKEHKASMAKPLCRACYRAHA